MTSSLVNETGGARTPLSGFIGAILSLLLLLLRRGGRPHTTEFGRVPSTEYFADMIRHRANVRVSQTFIFRTDGALLYFNTEYISDQFFALLNSRGEDVM